MTTFTQEDLVRYLYGETSPYKSELIRQALESDYSLREQLEQLEQSKKLLDQVDVQPRKELLDKIFAYAKKSTKEESTPS
jgi:hypothetical protein